MAMVGTHYKRVLTSSGVGIVSLRSFCSAQAQSVAADVAAVSSLGGFRTPAPHLARPSRNGPASETLHQGGRTQWCEHLMTSLIGTMRIHASCALPQSTSSSHSLNPPNPVTGTKQPDWVLTLRALWFGRNGR